MNEIKDNLNDTKYLLEDSEYKSVNLEEYSNLKNNILNNTQLLLEDKSSILNEIPNDNNKINYNEGILNNINNNNIINNDSKNVIDNSIKEILENNNDINEENEKEKDEQEIIKQQNILLNNQSSHLEELFSLSYTQLSHNNNQGLKYPPINKILSNRNNTNSLYKDIKYINKEKEFIDKIYFGILFPTEIVVKKILYKNNETKKIVCFKIRKNKNNHFSEYFKILIDKNKYYYNLKSNEEVNIKVSLEIPFIKYKRQVNCILDIIDINNNLIDSFFLYANIEIPKLCCLRHKNNSKEFNKPLIQIKLNCQKNQIFRIPFKNFSIKDMKINFNLLSSPNNEDDFNKYFVCDINLKPEKYFQIQSYEVNFFEILIDLEKNKELDNKEIKFKTKKVLEANIAETKINYYFFLELIIENLYKDNIIEIN